MYFGFGPYGFGMPPNRQQQQHRQPQPPFFHQPQQQPRQHPQQPQRQQEQPGFLQGFTNFINDNFMNPQQSRSRPQPQPQEQPQPRPNFYRSKAKQEKSFQQPPPPQKKEEIVYDENTGIYWKNKGNQAYQAKQYQQAIRLYSKAISKSNQSVFYSNRAQCYRKLGQLQQALQDAQVGVELDETNIRAHLICGQALAQFGKHQQNPSKVQIAIRRFTRALTLSGGKRIELEKEISRYIYLAKKVLFYMRFRQLRNARIRAINQYKEYLDRDESLSSEEKERKMEEFLNASNESISFIIPEYLTCRITLELMEDPVVTDSGQTYEREAIEAHIQKNGKTDPFTRQPIKGPLYPNVSVKKAVQQFLEHNPWAYEYCEGEDYKDIAF